MLVAIAALIGIFAALSYKGTPFQVHGSQKITMEHIFNGTFSAQTGDVRWIAEGKFSSLRWRGNILMAVYGKPAMACLRRASTEISI